MKRTLADKFFSLLSFCAICLSSRNGAVFAEFLEQHALGVYHYPFLGVANLSDGTQMPGLLHVWLKALRREGYVEVKGFYFMDPAEDTDVLLGHGHQSTSYYLWNPTIYLQEYMSAKRHTFTVIKHHRGTSFDKFSCIDVWMNISNPKPQYRMGVDNWLRPNSFVMPRQVVEKTNWYTKFNSNLNKQSSDTPHFIAGLNPVHTTNRAVWIRLFSMYVSHHLKLGFHGVMLYMSRLQSKDLLRLDPELANALNVLLLIHDFDNAGYNPYPDNAPTDWAQAHISNQMILSLWGTGAWMIITDLDEFVAFPRPTTLEQEFSSGCLSSGSPQYLVWTVHYFCEEWLVQNNGQKPDLELWLTQPLSTFHQCYTTSLPDEVFRKAPKCRHTNCNWGGVFKGFVDTSRMLAYYIHYGCPVPGDAGKCEEHRVDYKKCILLVHFPNMFRIRREPGSENDNLLTFNDSSWHWMYQQ